MTTFRRKLIFAISLMLVAGLQFGCEEVNREKSPVELLISAEQITNIRDLFPPEDDPGNNDCDDPLVELTFRNLVKNPSIADRRLLDIRLHTKRTTYTRTDGGTVVPNSHQEAIGAIIPATGAGTAIGDSIIFEPDAFARPPFAALWGSEFGVDPETGRPFVRLTVTETYFGETLAGDKVSASVSFPVTVCAFCGGCE